MPEATTENNEVTHVSVENYSHMDEAVLVDSNGEKYAVGEDKHGFITILQGGLHTEKEGVFWAEEQPYHVSIPPAELEKALAHLP